MTHKQLKKSHYCVQKSVNGQFCTDTTIFLAKTIFILIKSFSKLILEQENNFSKKSVFGKMFDTSQSEGRFV